MSCDQSYPLPQVFLVNGGGPQQPGSLPNLVPCWSYPPAQETARRRGKRGGFMGVSTGLVTVVLMLFLLVFAALGIGAWQIINMQREVRELKDAKEGSKTERKAAENEVITPQKQIGVSQWMESGGKEERPSAHVMGRFEQHHASPNTLHWESRAGQAFTAGGVSYRSEDGALQVNETGLYHIYSRVELFFTKCPKPSFNHTVFVRRAGHAEPLKLIVAKRKGSCSQQQGHAWTTDSYLSAAMQLQKYDRVYVNISHPADLDHEHYGNFFGLYKI